MHNYFVAKIHWILARTHCFILFIASHCEAFILTTFEICGLNVKHHLLWWLTAIYKSFHIHLACNSFGDFSPFRIHSNGNYIDSFSFKLCGIFIFVGTVMRIPTEIDPKPSDVCVCSLVVLFSALAVDVCVQSYIYAHKFAIIEQFYMRVKWNPTRCNGFLCAR